MANGEWRIEEKTPLPFATRRLPERDDFSSNRHLALAYWWSMIFSENRYPLFGIMLSPNERGPGLLQGLPTEGAVPGRPPPPLSTVSRMQCSAERCTAGPGSHNLRVSNDPGSAQQHCVL